MTKFDKLLLFGLFAFTNLIFLASVILLNVNQSKNNPLVTSVSGSVLSAQVTPSPSATPIDSTITPLPTPPSALFATIPQQTPDYSGPILSFQITNEGKPSEDQSNRVFVGIAQGDIAANPQFLLSFMADVPASGVVSGISLVGLSPGLTYTAYIKGSAQLVFPKTFTMQPKITNLGIINLISGDLNEDNSINSVDLSLAKQLVGTTPNSQNWNVYADLNGDSKVDDADLAIISVNLGKAGLTGKWTSSSIQTASSSATLNDLNEESTPSASTGYWLWVPKI
jgi:hypothetical protein